MEITRIPLRLDISVSQLVLLILYILSARNNAVFFSNSFYSCTPMHFSIISVNRLRRKHVGVRFAFSVGLKAQFAKFPILRRSIMNCMLNDAFSSPFFAATTQRIPPLTCFYECIDSSIRNRVRGECNKMLGSNMNAKQKDFVANYLDSTNNLII